jgi:hypothetical protein
MRARSMNHSLSWVIAVSQHGVEQDIRTIYAFLHDHANSSGNWLTNPRRIQGMKPILGEP